ncbi:hypothetical protein CRENBAI_020078 [Crenichthys baileyi]|uniref:Uncharacterized protein n=1 Tax=Crenichthys baileyi TaxID=28760 RepID=A0AAV9RII7_9TELE
MRIFNSGREEPQTCPQGPKADTEEIGALGSCSNEPTGPSGSRLRCSRSIHRPRDPRPKGTPPPIREGWFPQLSIPQRGNQTKSGDGPHYSGGETAQATSPH